MPLSLPPCEPSTDRPSGFHTFFRRSSSHHPSLVDSLFTHAPRTRIPDPVVRSKTCRRAAVSLMSKSAVPPSPQEVHRKLSIHSTPKQPRVSANATDTTSHSPRSVPQSCSPARFLPFDSIACADITPPSPRRICARPLPHPSSPSPAPSPIPIPFSRPKITLSPRRPRSAAVPSTLPAFRSRPWIRSPRGR